MKLLIISATRFYCAEGTVAAFEPTLAEIEQLSTLYDQITWIGYRYDDPIPMNFRPDRSGKIVFKFFPPAIGGKSIMQKVRIIRFIPAMVYQLIREIRNAEMVHTRGPSVPALFAIAISCFDYSRRYWHKYAGNWVQTSPPFSYRVQRFLLRNFQRHKVTVNGNWPGEKKFVIGFENPCLLLDDRNRGREAVQKKKFDGPFDLCFVGRLEAAKGVSAIIRALNEMANPQQIRTMHFIGDGPERAAHEKMAASLKMKVQFHGFLSRAAIFSIMENCHFLLLPSASEGFPKVIAEAANFGCIPIVSNTSSIGQYVNDKNGFVWNISKQPFEQFFRDVPLGQPALFSELGKNAYEMAASFTYERYLARVNSEIIPHVFAS